MKSALAALAPVHHDLLEVAAAHVAGDYAGEQFAPAPSQLKTDDPLLALLGHPQLVAIAQVDRELALTLKAVLDLIEDADFASAMNPADKLCHLIRRHYLASRSDATGTLQPH